MLGHCVHIIVICQKHKEYLMSVPIRSYNIIICIQNETGLSQHTYLDQKYLLSERSERGRYELIQVTCAEIILSHFESI